MWRKWGCCFLPRLARIGTAGGWPGQRPQGHKGDTDISPAHSPNSCSKPSLAGAGSARPAVPLALSIFSSVVPNSRSHLQSPCKLALLLPLCRPQAVMLRTPSASHGVSFDACCSKRSSRIRSSKARDAAQSDLYERVTKRMAADAIVGYVA